MTLTQDVFKNNELYYTLHVLNNKRILMMDLLKMYVLFSRLVFYQRLIKKIQGCQR